MRNIVACAVVISLLVVSCNSSNTNGREVVFKTNSNLIVCSGSGPVPSGKNCFVAYKQDDNTYYQFGINSIKGFEFVEGFIYTLSVKEVRVENPPPDGPNYSHTLIKILDKVAAP